MINAATDDHWIYVDIPAFIYMYKLLVSIDNPYQVL